MATSTLTAGMIGTTSGTLVGKAPVVVLCGTSGQRRRLTSEAEQAVEKLSHAIQYLAGDCIYEGESFNLADPRVEAVLMLLERNREIYFSCPAIPSLTDRVKIWLGLKAA